MTSPLSPQIKKGSGLTGLWSPVLYLAIGRGGTRGGWSGVTGPGLGVTVLGVTAATSRSGGWGAPEVREALGEVFRGKCHCFVVTLCYEVNWAWKQWYVLRGDELVTVSVEVFTWICGIFWFRRLNTLFRFFHFWLFRRDFLEFDRVSLWTAFIKKESLVGFNWMFHMVSFFCFRRNNLKINEVL